MNYALIENGFVTNVIVLLPGNAADFPNAVPVGDHPVTMGDAYADGHFYRDGVEVLSEAERLRARLAQSEEIEQIITGGAAL